MEYILQTARQTVKLHGMKRLINRFQTDILSRHLRHFPVVAVIGARQTGKTTLVRDLLPGKRKFISFDEPVNMMLAELIRSGPTANFSLPARPISPCFRRFPRV
jgi:translation initiation factor RLI1